MEDRLRVFAIKEVDHGSKDLLLRVDQALLVLIGLEGAIEQAQASDTLVRVVLIGLGALWGLHKGEAFVLLLLIDLRPTEVPLERDLVEDAAELGPHCEQPWLYVRRLRLLPVDARVVEEH